MGGGRRLAGDFRLKSGEDTSLHQALGLTRGEIISLTGGGGKSTLMRQLALELADAGYKVIITTTTHILPDQGAGFFILEANKKELFKKIKQAGTANPIITVTCGQEANGKLKGPDPETIPELLAFSDFIIVEADGAQRKPLKAPNETEPVIVPETNIVVAVAGIDGVGKIAKDVVFRHEIAGRLIGISADAVVTAADVAKLLAHPEGITRTSPPSARKVAFINKVESAQEQIDAIKIVECLKKQTIFNHVIIGSLLGKPPSIRLIQIN